MTYGVHETKTMLSQASLTYLQLLLTASREQAEARIARRSRASATEAAAAAAAEAAAAAAAATAAAPAAVGVSEEVLAIGERKQLGIFEGRFWVTSGSSQLLKRSNTAHDVKVSRHHTERIPQ